ncbi:hypothetical protein [Prevotella sp.]|uniref:hypothetical protein n=1 Tax=Prevotella sp. TaxID=59823 RepID=UPI00264889EA|nr:hypothetical protein [Prevotella sp.]MDN5553379.1 hypothetical protein [Prevotella sp.]
MEKDFDFEKIGKNTPYFTPESFFDDMQKKILRTAEKDVRKRRQMKIVFIALLASAAVFAGLIFFPFANDIVEPQQPQLAKTDTTLGKTSTVHAADVTTYPLTKGKNARIVVNNESRINYNKKKNTATAVQSDDGSTSEEWIEQLSDEDLKSLTSMADNDEFLN